MSEHPPGAKPIDPDTTDPQSQADEVKKRDRPGLPDQPEKPEGVVAPNAE